MVKQEGKKRVEDNREDGNKDKDKSELGYIPLPPRSLLAGLNLPI